MWDILSDGGVNKLAYSKSDHGGFACAGLGLGNDVTALNDGPDGPLLDCRRLLEAITVDSSKQIVLDTHLIEAKNGLNPLRSHELELILHRRAAPSSGGSVRRNHTGCGGGCHGQLIVKLAGCRLRELFPRQWRS